MFIGPIIEEWLLSGKAQLKNISLGGGGLISIPVPEGKSYIITEIEILPFLNIITDDNRFANPQIFEGATPGGLVDILKRTQYQLTFYNPRINNTYNVRTEFIIQNSVDYVSEQRFNNPGIKVPKQQIKTFAVVESTSWIWLRYFDFVTNPGGFKTDNYNNILDGSQNFESQNAWSWTDQLDNYVFSTIAGKAYRYRSVGNQPGTVTEVDQFILPTLNSTDDPLQDTTFNPPFPAGINTINQNNMLSMPYYNIQVIEVNKRLGSNLLL